MRSYAALLLALVVGGCVTATPRQAEYSLGSDFDLVSVLQEWGVPEAMAERRSVKSILEPRLMRTGAYTPILTVRRHGHWVELKRSSEDGDASCTAAINLQTGDVELRADYRVDPETERYQNTSD